MHFNTELLSAEAQRRQKLTQLTCQHADVNRNEGVAPAKLVTSILQLHWAVFQKRKHLVTNVAAH